MNDTRKIVSFLAFAVAFAVVGNTLKGGSASTDVKIFLGGGLGAVFLSLLAEAGDTAGEFAVGVAFITLLASVLANGEPVFNAVSNLTGKLKTTPAPAKAAAPSTTTIAGRAA